ncbi:MAG: response regulator [Deltaproteobacteria bacterium]
MTDSGCGMGPDVVGRIFDPFFTTKLTGRGLGLSAMLGILRSHGAGIQLRTEVGKGSTFDIYFPVTTESSPAEPPRRKHAVSVFEGRLLLVDDERAILETTGGVLTGLGFEVVFAADGLEALSVLAREGPAIRLVLMDLTMPRMDGQAAFLEMHRLYPRLPVILTSGYDEQEFAAHFQGQGLAGFIEKPYRLAVLESALRRALSAIV